MAGAGGLSARARDTNASHVPPVDYRWGWRLGHIPDHLAVMYGLIVYGCRLLVAAPNCHPWGARSRAWPGKQRAHARNGERLTLQFLAARFVIQLLLGRHAVYETPEGSGIPTPSP